MKIPFDVECRKCKNDLPKTINLNDSTFEYICACGYRGNVSLGNTYTIGSKILIKSHHEYRVNKDYTISVLLSAMALEADIAHWFFKWKEIEQLEDPNNNSGKIDYTKIESEYSRLRGIKDKITEASKLMYSDGLDEFVKNDSQLSKDITNNYKMLDKDNLIKSMIEKLFWPRNKIVHRSYADYDEQKAKECINISDLGIFIFQKLDEFKRNK